MLNTKFSPWSISEDEHGHLTDRCSKIGAMLGSMLKNPDPFLKKEYLTTEYTESTEKKQQVLEFFSPPSVALGDLCGGKI
jgi:hypothetical protein